MPYMSDERHAPDTLFIVLEEDFRIYKDGGFGGPGEEKARREQFELEEEEPETRMDDLLELYRDRCQKTEILETGPWPPGEPVAPGGGKEWAGYGFFARTAKP